MLNITPGSQFGIVVNNANSERVNSMQMLVVVL